MPSLNSNIPRDLRQKALTKCHQEFLRIYSPLKSCKRLASDHAIKQELDLHRSSGNKKQQYSSMAIFLLKRLRERPEARDASDVGIDGKWIPNKSHVDSVDPLLLDVSLCESLESLIETREKLIQFGYPMADLPKREPSIPDATEAVGKTVECDRCSCTFKVKYPLGLDDDKACTYHFGRLRSLVKSVNRAERLLHTCCMQDSNSEGCTKGPHVYKLDVDEELHKQIPFTKLEERKERCLPIAAVDCEMAYTTGGSELIRVTVVDWNSSKVFDELCKPFYPVLDLNSRWSGITTLGEARMNLHEIRAELSKILTRDTILVGHGLENDLRALRLQHERVIDTAILYEHPNGGTFRYSLKRLAEQHLDKIIQKGAEGHDSFEDASVALTLVKKRVEQQPAQKNQSH